MQGNIARYGHRGQWQLRLFRYGGALVSFAVGLSLALALHPALDPEAPLLATVLVAAWLGGLGPALLATVLTTLAVEYYFTPPILSFAVAREYLPRVVMFALLAVSFSLLTAARRRAKDLMRQAHEEMETHVQQRTAELRKTNQQLESEIAERGRAEAALKRQADLLEQAHEAIIVWEFPRRIVYWNRGAEHLYGFSRDEAIGRHTHELLQTVHPMPARDFDRALERDGHWTGQLTHTTRDGRTLLVESRMVLTRDPDGSPLVLETNRDITERKRAEQALEALAGRLIHAQEEERSRIGRELHDHISQTLGVLTIKIDQLRVNGAVTPDVDAVLAELRRDSSEITDDVHRLSHRLHSSTLDYLGLVPALQKLVAEFAARHDISIKLTHDSLPASLSSEVALCLFRIAEESLTNIVKHSQARSATIHVSGAPDGLHLAVEDTGVGFDMTAPGGRAGLGFVSMQERLRVLHGTVHVDSAPTKGTRIEAWVPRAAFTSPTEVAH